MAVVSVAFSSVVPLPLGSTEDGSRADAEEVFEALLVDRGLVLASEVRAVFLPYRPVAAYPAGSVVTNGPELPAPLTSLGPVWQFTAYVDPV